MERREIMKARRPEGETYGHALRGADQMQSPAEELFFLGRTVTAEIKSAHFATTPCSDAFANRYRQAVNNEDFAARGDFTQHFERQVKPVGVLVQATVETRNAQMTREVMRLLQEQQGAFVVIVEVLGRHQGDGQHFG